MSILPGPRASLHCEEPCQCVGHAQVGRTLTNLDEGISDVNALYLSSHAPCDVPGMRQTKPMSPRFSRVHYRYNLIVSDLQHA